MLSDLRFALRTLARTPVFTASAVLTLALGIGVNTTIFSVANGALFRYRPGIQDAGRIAWIASVFKESGRRAGLSYPDYLDYRAGTTSVFSDVAAYRNVPISLGSGGTPERVRGQMVTGSLFPMLGAPMASGRALGPGDDVRGAAPAALISEQLWKRRFAGAPDVFGLPLVLNGRDFTVVGIVSAAFRGPAIGDAADVWLPMASWPEMRASERTLLESRGSSWLTVLGRLRPSVSMQQAQAAVGAVAAQLLTRYPDSHEDRSAVVTGAGSPVSPEGRDELVPLAALLLTVTALVLLIACANVANLLLARGAGRTLEISLRWSLGASRPRLIRQLLIESAVLAVAGGAGGLLLAAWTADLLLGFAGSDLEGLQAAPDLRVILCTAGIAAVSVLGAALVPALATTRADVMRGLRATPGAGRRSRLQGLFVVTELALSLVLLLAAGLSLHALQQSSRIDLGFTAENLTTASYDLVLQNYPEPRRDVFRRELTARVRTLPGVESIAIANLAPLGGTMVGAQAATLDDTVRTMTFVTAVGAGYFSTLRIPIVRGRAIDARDSAAAPGAVVVNQTLARRLWRDVEPVGQQLRLDRRTSKTLQVVGVARDARYDDPTEDPQSFLYLSLAQDSAFDTETVFVRTLAGTASPGPGIERIIRALDPALPVYDVRPFSAILHERVDKQRGLSLLFTAFGALALALAALGLYGVMSSVTARRTRELGVRLALGASPSQLAAMVARDGLVLGAIGTALGAALALPLARAIGALLFGVELTDVAVFAAVCAALNAVVFAAALLPARRAARLDPITALRME